MRVLHGLLRLEFRWGTLRVLLRRRLLLNELLRLLLDRLLRRLDVNLFRRLLLRRLLVRPLLGALIRVMFGERLLVQRLVSLLLSGWLLAPLARLIEVRGRLGHLLIDVERLQQLLHVLQPLLRRPPVGLRGARIVVRSAVLRDARQLLQDAEELSDQPLRLRLCGGRSI